MIEWLAYYWAAFLFWGFVSLAMALIALWRIHTDKFCSIGWVFLALVSAPAVLTCKVLFILSLICNALIYLKR